MVDQLGRNGGDVGDGRSDIVTQGAARFCLVLSTALLLCILRMLAFWTFSNWKCNARAGPGAPQKIAVKFAPAFTLETQLKVTKFCWYIIFSAHEDYSGLTSTLNLITEGGQGESEQHGAC